MPLRGYYITECIGEIDRRIGYIEKLEDQFRKSKDTGVENIKTNDGINDVLQSINEKLDDMREEFYIARSKLADDVSDIGGWL